MYLRTSASIDLPIASRFSAGTWRCIARAASCIICAAGRSTMLRDTISISDCWDWSTRWTSSFLVPCALAAVRHDDRDEDDGALRFRIRGRMITRRLPEAPAHPPCSSISPLASFSTMRCRLISLAPSSSAMRVTPCVARPSSRISATRVRTSTPRSVISMISSSGRTSVAATTLPLRSDLLDRDHSLGSTAMPRVLGDRRALAVAVLRGREDALRFVLGDEHGDDALRRLERHAAHAARAAAHRRARPARRSERPCRRR